MPTFSSRKKIGNKDRYSPYPPEAQRPMRPLSMFFSSVASVQTDHLKKILDCNPVSDTTDTFGTARPSSQSVHEIMT
jgi:hypothetical protein